MAFTVLISTVNALSFSPAMAALLLRSPTQTPGLGLPARFFRGFNHHLRRVMLGYGQAVSQLIRQRYSVVALFVAGLALMGLMLKLVPTGFVPAEDQGYVIGVVQAPDGVSLSYTQAVMARSQAILAQFPEIQSTFLISGFSFDGTAPNRGVFFATLTPWPQRQGAKATAFGLLPRVNQALETIQEARVIAFNAAPVPGFSPTNALEMQLQDRSGGQLSLEDFLKNSLEVIGLANRSPTAAGVFSSFTASMPQIEVELDRDRIKTLHIDLAEAQSTLRTYLGSRYINDFSFGGRNYPVLLQADAPFRNDPEDIRNIYLRSKDGTLVSLAALSRQREVSGPATISHFNLFRSIKIEGQPAPQASSGQLITAMTAAHDQAALPSVGVAWQGSARVELAAGKAALVLFGLGLVVVFLVLAAQYESYLDPVIILLTVPLAVLGALIFLWLRDLALNVYAQVGLVMLIGLASKNAILIVEFANQARHQGLDLVPAVINACQQRFRPIIMTSTASLAGFFPLLIARGAGSSSRWSIGYTVFGGLLVATLLSLLVVPVFYVLFKGLTVRPRMDPASRDSHQKQL
ncbi:MAG: efflux RND transporter permease subunit [Nodosilinea sp. LVE1205-7]